MTSTQRKRLLKMADFIKKLPKEKFDIDVVRRDESKDVPLPKHTIVKETYCGTACCIIGWTPKLFPRLCKWRLADDCGEAQRESIVDYKGNYYIKTIAQQLFGLTPDEAELIYPHWWDEKRKTANPANVSKELRRLAELHKES